MFPQCHLIRFTLDSNIIMKKRTLCLFIILSPLFSIYSHTINFKHIGIAEGLSQLSVMSIHQDKLGRMWFGTEEGLNMYDGQRIKVFKPRYKIDAYSIEGNYGLLGNNNYPITEDKNGDLFFCSDAALIKFNLARQEFSAIRKKEISTVTSCKGEIWFVAKDSIFKIQKDSIQFVSRINNLKQVNCIHIRENSIWLGADTGLYVSDSTSASFTLFSGSTIQSIFEDSQHTIWVATLKDGAFKVDSNKNITRYMHEKNNPNSISSDIVRCFAEDDNGKIWIGTFKGLNRLDPSTGDFTFYTSGRKHGLSHSSVFSLCKDQQGNMWAGTYYGGVNFFNPGTGLFTYYSEDDLNFPFIGSMAEDTDHNLWICTEGGGLTRFNHLENTFEHLNIQWIETNNVIHHNNLKAICYEPRSERLFIGTHTGGLSCYYPKSKTFKHYYLQSPEYGQTLGTVVDNLAIYKNQLIIQVRGGIYTMNLDNEQFAPLLNDKRYTHYWTRTFTVDSKGYIWIAGHSQLIRIKLDNPSDKKTFLLEKKGLGKFYITKIIEDYQHNIYIGTRGSGLYKYEEQTDSFKTYTEADNTLLSDYCYDIAITRKGNLIITGNRGITLFNPIQNKSKFIGLENSIALSAINIGCKAYVCQNGEIFVGGVNGLISFREEAIQIQQSKSRLYFSSLWINNQEVYPGDNSKVLTQTMPLVKAIDLTYQQNSIIFNFASTNYASILQSGIYEYMLEGLDRQWNSTNRTSISYSNLPTGKYKLLIREKNTKDPNYTPLETSLEIEIHPVIYQTTLAYIIYALTVLYILSCFVRFYYSRLKLKASLEFERASKEQIKELNQIKINFFTTVSHEFRTPLTLIISQMDLLLQSNLLTPNVYNKMSKIYKNALSMKELISELLTFQKLNQSSMTLKVKEINLSALLKEVYLSFSDYANMKQITYDFSSPNPNTMCWADISQLKKVFYNLLGNAFKYTAEYGKIEIVLAEKEHDILIQFIDNGQGICPKEQEKIFDVFYQIKDNQENACSQTGSGIGLSLAKKIVEAHHGEIKVTSQTNYGSIFTVILTKGKFHLLNDKSVYFEEDEDEKKEMCQKILEEVSITSSDNHPATEQTHTILIIEDNQEMLQVLQALFSPVYKVLIAHNGKEGLNLAMETPPDIILSDIMMPEMSGKELCMHIKNNFDLCHIPVVLLTALDSDEERLEGLTQRADDYVSKPFNSKQLIVRCNNLVYNREQLQRKFSKQEDNSPSRILATNPLDEKFLQQIDEIIIKNLDKEEFDINQLIQEMSISRSSLYAKFKALSGISPNEYLINCRLKHAANLLKKHPELQIAEVSYQVGFSSPRYFSKCFKDMFGTSPADYKKNTRT